MMKKTHIVILTTLLVSLFWTAPTQAMGKDMPKNEPMSAAKIEILVQRMQEIKEMDLSTLAKDEKKELKAELREIKKNLKKDGGGVYFSVGALLVVIILLILLL